MVDYGNAGRTGTDDLCESSGGVTTEQKESSMHVLVTVVILSLGFFTGYVVAGSVYDRVTLWE